VIHRDDNIAYLYPTALLKQLDLDGVEEIRYWPEYDIIMELNNMKEWNVDDSTATNLGTLRDLELHTLHEVIHGLGFGDDTMMSQTSRTRQDLQFPTFRNQPELVAPALMPGVAPRSTDIVYEIAGPTIWNRFVMIDNRPLKDHFVTLRDRFHQLRHENKFQASNDGGLRAESVVTSLVQDRDAKNILDLLTRKVTQQGGVVVQTNAWGATSQGRASQEMETSGQFRSGLSLCHVASSQANTQEFLMVMPGTLTRSLSAMVQAVSNMPQSGIGPNTREVLLAMGYAPDQAVGPTPRRDHAFIDPPALTMMGTGARRLPSLLLLGSLLAIFLANLV
jgi:hypothetical protein